MRCKSGFQRGFYPLGWRVRIPEHPVSHSNDIRSTVPGYPVTFDAPLLSVWFFCQLTAFSPTV